MRQVRIAVCDLVAGVADEEVGSGPEDGPTVRVVGHSEQLRRDLELGGRPARVEQGEEEGFVGGNVLALAVGAGPGHVSVSSADTTWAI